MTLYLIRFSGKSIYDGMSTIFAAGPGVFGRAENEFWVPEPSLRRLDEARIPYKILVGERNYRRNRDNVCRSN